MKRPAQPTARSTVATGIVPIAAIALAVVSVGAGSLPPAHQEQDLSAKDLARRVVIHNRPYTGAIFADYVPSAEEVQAPFAPAMARNEYEPMQVGLYVPSGEETLKNVTLEVRCPLHCQVGHLYYMPAEELNGLADSDESLVQANFPNATWPCDPKRLVGQRASLPMYVLPVPRIAEIRPGHSAAFWMTFRTDGKTAAGTHPGTFVVRAEGEVVATVPFEVEVYPFVLPRPKVHYGMYYMPYQTPAAFQGRDFQKQYLADLAAHGMNFMNLDVEIPLLAQKGYDLESSTPVGPPEHNAWGSVSTRLFLGNYLGPEDYQPDGGYNALKLIDTQIRMGREAGLIQRDHPAVTAQSGFNVPNKALALAKIRQYGAARDWPPLLLYMRDEPGPEVFAEVMEHVGEWKRLGAAGIAAMSGLAAFGVGSVHSAWTVLAGQISPELRREAEGLGAQLWTYDYNLRTTNIEANRFFAGLYTWSWGLQGNMPYAYMGEPHQQPHFDAQWKLSGPSILGYVIPSPAGPVPGVGWEGRREGVDDVRYLQLLEARLDAAREDDPTAREVRQWLACLRDRSRATEFQPYRFNAWGADYLDPHSGLAPGDYDAIRAAAAGFIMRLPPATGETNPEPPEGVHVSVKPLEGDAFAEATLSECLRALETGTISEQRQAASALTRREESEVLPALPLLIPLLDEPEVRLVALRALANLGPQAAPAIPALRPYLDSEDAFIRVGVTYTLTRIGPAAAAALARCVRDPDPSIAALARDALDHVEKP